MAISSELYGITKMYGRQSRFVSRPHYYRKLDRYWVYDDDEGGWRRTADFFKRKIPNDAFIQIDIKLNLTE